VYLIPLNQLESVELVVHALKVAAGEADCTACPVRRVCMRQCQSLADAIDRLLQSGTLPRLGDGAPEPSEPPSPATPAGGDGKGGHLTVVK